MIFLISPLAAPAIEYDPKLGVQQVIQAGEKVVISVTVSGIPVPSVTWTCGEKTLTTADRVTIDSSDTYSTLTIKKSVKEETGIYTVTAENVVGSTHAEFDVKVIGKCS